MAGAAFTAVPGSSFLLPGTRPASDTALLGADLAMHAGDFSYGLNLESQFGGGTTIFQGLAGISWQL